ncbi:MAG: hypothetical protein WD850_00165, partial [Candidatus Spechtbacterales bacterium]
MKGLLKQSITLLLALTILASLSLAPPLSFASSPTFTNNNAPAASPNPGNENVLVFDLTLPAPDSDTFLDSDGTGTTGAGTAAAITAGDVLKALALAGGTTLCGNTDGTTAPTNLVYNSTSSGCAQNILTTVDSADSVGEYTSIAIG